MLERQARDVARGVDVGEPFDAGVLVDGDEVLAVARYAVDAPPEDARQRNDPLGGQTAAVTELESAFTRPDGIGGGDDLDPVAGEQVGDELACARRPKSTSRSGA